MDYNKKKKKQLCSNWVLAIFIIVAILLVAGACIFKAVAESDSKKRLKLIENEIKYQGIVTHLKQLDILRKGRSTPENYNRTASYIKEALKPYNSYYTYTEHPVKITVFDLVPGSAILEAVFTGTRVVYVPELDFSVEVPPSNNASFHENLTLAQNGGCNASDYEKDTLAIVDTTPLCSFDDIIEAATNAEVKGVIIVLDPGKTPTPPTKRRTTRRSVPVFTLRDAAGSAMLVAVEAGAKVGQRVTVTAGCKFTETVKTSYNLLVYSNTYKTNNTIILGAHMDSSSDSGPAINDNGSGIATILEFAKLSAQYNIYKEAQQRIVYAFWGLEEEGQLGSLTYINELTPGERYNTVAYVNAYMLGSPNYAYFVSNASEALPRAYAGTAYINYNITGTYITKKAGNCEVAPVASVTSDHVSFMEAGIPTVNICSGADGAKTKEEYYIYGGYIYAPYDSCHHRTCDTLAHIARKPLEILAKAVAHTTETLLVEKNIREVLKL